MRRVFGNHARQRARNTGKRQMLLMAAAKFAGRKGGPKKYNLLHSSLYKALTNYMNQANIRNRNLIRIRNSIYNMPVNTGEIINGRSGWWISPTHINPNTGRYNTVHIQRGNNFNNMRTLVYNPVTRRYNLQ